MVGIAIAGILSSIAVPAYNVYIAKAKLAETPIVLSNIFQQQSSYYLLDHFNVAGQATAKNCLLTCVGGNTDLGIKSIESITRVADTRIKCYVGSSSSAIILANEHHDVFYSDPQGTGRKYHYQLGFHGWRLQLG